MCCDRQVVGLRCRALRSHDPITDPVTEPDDCVHIRSVCVCVCVCSYCVTFFKKNYAYAGEHGNGTDDVFEAASSGYHKRRQPVMSRAPATTTKKAGNRDEARQKLKFLRSVAKNCNEQDSARPSKRPKVGGLPDRRRPRPTATSLLRA